MKVNKKIGILAPEVLLPSDKVDLNKWAVVACDQYTSQREYWENVKQYVGDSPSTLNIVFPEVYLEDSDREERIKSITQTMHIYLNETLVSIGEGYIYIERETENSGIRKGLIVALDLEQYSYAKDSQTLIRATEGTVLERIPPRVHIREGAIVESPHIMILIDDSEKTVIEPLEKDKDKRTKLYDFELMMDGGHIKGWHINDNETIDRINSSIEKLMDSQGFKDKYDLKEDKNVLLYAVGDGNHSLATAKACWEQIKENLAQDETENHPARYALVELVNVHDSGLFFEPIHRVLFNVSPEKLLQDMISYYSHTKEGFKYELYQTQEQAELNFDLYRQQKDIHAIPFVYDESWGILSVPNPSSNLPVGTLQNFLDDYLEKHPETTIDYIHGEDVVTELGTKKGNMGFYLPPMDKNDLFKTVILDGVLPRKTFSMGEAEEKRFYLECRKIVK